MRLDRRNFLKFAVGATGGFMLTPINWKLMDDVAIWTQNWSWVPVVKDGARAYASTACQFCGGGCGLKVRLIDGQRAVNIQGDPANPINRGGICSWGAAGLQYQYLEENRVTGPMVRDSKISAWRKISWEEGLKLLQAKLGKAAPDKVAFLSGRKRSSMSNLMSGFTAALGSPNYLELPDSGDVQVLAAQSLLGQPVRYGYDLERADVVLSFGAALIEGWGSPVRMQRAFELWRGRTGNQAKIIQVEPRTSTTASKANLFLAPQPGTEAILALGLAKALIDSGRVALTAKAAPGFADLAEMLGEYEAEAVSEATGVAPAKIAEAAKMFAAAKRGVAVTALGQGVRPEPYDLAWAGLVLNLLKGNLGRPGGVFPVAELPQADLNAPAASGKRIDGRDGGPVNLAAMAHNIVSGKAGLDVLMVFEANPVFTGPDNEEIRAMMTKIPFRVSFSPFWDETTNACDLVLPNCAPLERWDDVETPLGLPYQTVSLARPLFEPKYDTQPTGDLLLGLAAKLGHDLGQKSFEELIAARLDKLSGGAVGGDDLPAPGKMLTGTDGETAEADILGAGSWYQTTDRPSVSPRFEDRPEEVKALEPTGSEDSYPLKLVVFESIRIASGFYANPPFVTKLLDDDVLLKKDVFVNLHPSTAGELGLKEGDPAMLKTPAGSARVKVHLTEGAMPETAFLPLGLGRTSWDGTIRDKGINGANLIPALEDEASGLPLTYLARANLVKA